MQASKDVLALASLEVDLANIEPGSTVTVKWRGKPVFVRHRTEEDIAKANDVHLNELRDPEVRVGGFAIVRIWRFSCGSTFESYCWMGMNREIH